MLFSVLSVCGLHSLLGLMQPNLNVWITLLVSACIPFALRFTGLSVLYGKNSLFLDGTFVVTVLQVKHIANLRFHSPD